jgi:hypothetical protein
LKDERVANFFCLLFFHQITLLIKSKLMKIKILSATLFFLFNIIFLKSNAQALVDVETGLVFTGYNNVRIPGNQGTLFSLKDDLIPKANLFYRIRLNYIIKSRHTISLLYAPLLIKSSGVIKNNIIFEGVIFPANKEVSGTYKFNSYRLTYRYDIVQKPKLVFGLGLTAKIRDAKIALSSSTLSAAKPNVGFLPIVNFRLLWHLNKKFGVLLDGDALAAPQGRAEDVQIAATYNLKENLNIRAGYRVLEGGADNDEVYNFTLIHYASIGIAYTFKKIKM